MGAFIKRRLLFLIAGVLALVASNSAQAYFATMDSGEMVAPDKYQVMLEPQLILSRFDGFNLVGRFDTGLNESSSVRGVLGFGKVDFQLGGFYKFIPFPDTAKQPAMGGEAGILFARVNGETEVSVRVHPLVSKRFETEIGDLVPYGSLPFGVTSRASETAFPIQIVGGSELRPLNTPNLSFFAEVGINLNKSFSYIAGALAYRFDEASLKSE